MTATETVTATPALQTNGPVPWPLAAGVGVVVLSVSLIGGTVGIVATAAVIALALVVARHRATSPSTWTAGTVAAGTAVAQAAFSGHISYMTRAVDPTYGWATLALIYTIPVVAAATTVWAGLRLRDAGRGRVAIAGACLAALAGSVGVAVVGGQIGHAVAGM